jgi:hypothetical protein
MPEPLAAEALAQAPPDWIALPTAILTLIGLVVAVPLGLTTWRKGRVETRHKLLEIEKLERELGEASPATRSVVQDVMRPVAETRRTEALIVRFALLFVALLVWDVLAQVYDFFMRLVFVGINAVGPITDESPAVYVFYVLTILPDVGRILLVVALGLPFSLG